MAKNFLTPIDLNQNEIRNVVLQPLGTAPSNPKEAQFYYNSTEKKMYQWNGTSWKQVGDINVIEKIKLNGSEVTPSNDKTVDLGTLLKFVRNTGDAPQRTLVVNVDGTDAYIPLVSSDKLALTGYQVRTATSTAPGVVRVDDSLDSNSTNPVQNKAIKSVLDKTVPTTRTVNGKALSSDITLSASDVGADASGTAQTKANAALADAKTYVDGKISTLMDGATDTTLDSIKELANAIKSNDSAINTLNNIAGGKASASDLTAHTENTSNPHEVTKAQVGLGNVENKSSATIRGELTKSNVTTALGYTPHGTAVATASANGLMSKDDKQILDNVNARTLTIMTSFTATLTAGETEIILSGVPFETTNVHFNAYDAVTGEEVIIDSGTDGKGNMLFCITRPYSNDIRIVYSHQTNAV